jgi:tetratricopeptide (TPR) repeat protein
MRKLNFLFLAALLTATIVSGAAVYGLHRYQMRVNAKALRDMAERAETEGDLDKAASFLTRYIGLRHEDGPAYARYARIIDRATPPHARGENLLAVYEEALRHNLGDREIEKRCADIAMEPRIQRYQDAIRHLERLHEPIRVDQNRAHEAAELEDLLGQCQQATAKTDQAVQSYKQSIEKDPARVATFDRLARVLHEALKDHDQADRTIDDMMRANPQSALALVTRYRYQKEFGQDAQDSDIDKALKLAPDEPEVLIAAAELALRKNELARARELIDRGLKRHPANAYFYLLSAGPKLAEKQPEAAETVLRQGIAAVAESDYLKFSLTDLLIDQAKLESDEGAIAWIDRLSKLGLRDGYTQFLEARVAMTRQEWSGAISRLETVRSLLADNRDLLARVDLMLWECYGKINDQERQIAALQRAAASETTSRVVRPVLAEKLEQSGRLDEAISQHLLSVDARPQSRLDLVRLLIQKNTRLPKAQQRWDEVERRLREAEEANPQAVESLTLYRANMLAAQNRLDEARTLLTTAQATDPKNLKFRLLLARLADVEKGEAEALKILDQAEKDLGPSLDITLARLDHWVQKGGLDAKAAVASLAARRNQLPDADRPRFLDQVAKAEIRLGEPALARQHLREFSTLRPDDLDVLLARFDLALVEHDVTEASQLVEAIRNCEGQQGTEWRVAVSLLSLDRARHGEPILLEDLRGLASEIEALRPNWWGASLLKAQIAELENQPGQALACYKEAVRLGYAQPSVVRRLIDLLYQGNLLDEINRLPQLFRDRDIAIPELTMVNAINAMRKGDFDQGIALARQVISDASTSFADQLTLGRFYLTAGRTEEAGKYLKRAVDLGPGVPDTWLSYVHYLVQVKHLDQAKAAVEALRKALPTDRLTLVRCLVMVGDTVQAEKLIESALEDKPGDPATLRLAVSFYLEKGLTEPAGMYLQRLAAPAAGATDDDLNWANRARASLLVGKGRSSDADQALRLIDQNLSTKPDSIEDLRLKASILAQRSSRGDEAIRILEPLTAANLLTPDEGFLLAQLYLRGGQEAKYQQQMLKILEGNEKASLHLAHYTNYFISRNQLDQAERWLAVLRAQEPKGKWVLELEAALLKVRGRQLDLLTLLETRGREAPDQLGVVANLLNRYGFTKQAGEAYKAFVARDPKQPERRLALVPVLAGEGRTSEAFKILSEAWTACRPEQVAAAALALYDSPSADEAEKRQVEVWVAKAVEEVPAAVVLASRLGAIWNRQGRFEEAEALFRRLLLSNPDNPEALNGLAWLLALRDQSSTDEALKLINHAIDIRGRTAPLIDTHAVVLIRSNRPQDAIQELTDTQFSDTRDPSLPLHLAWAYQTAGQTDAARKAFAKAKALGWKPETSDPQERSFMEKLKQDLVP